MFIAWRDWVKDSTLTLGGSFPDELTSIENLKDRRLATTYDLNTMNGEAVGYISDFDQPRPVQLVSLLNHNINAIINISIGLYDQSDNELLFKNFQPWVPPENSGIPRHLFIPLSSEIQDVASLRVNFTVSDSVPITRVGRLWAGPLWTPSYGLGFDGTAFSVRDNSRVTESVSGQAYVTRRDRRRGMRLRFAGLTEEDAFASAADPGAQCAQALGFEAGTSEPVIVVPTTLAENSQQTEHLVHRLGMYGRIIRNDGVILRDAIAKDINARTRFYALELDLIEEL